MKGKDIVNAFEQSEMILHFTLPELGLPLWPFVRFVFLDMYSARVNNLTATSSTHNKSFQSILNSLITTSLKNPFLIKSKEVIFFNSGVTNVKLNSGEYFNRVTDYFYFQIPQKAALVEDLHGLKVVKPRVHSDVYYSLSLKAVTKAKSFFRSKKFEHEAQNEINNLIKYLHSIAPLNVDDRFWEDCQTIFAKQVFQIKTELSFYKSFLSKKAPKIIFLEDASYGSKLPLLLASKSLKIPVAELQHGLINENHLAYAFGKGVVDNFLPYLPDYFLSYSQYWSNSINLPSEKVEIGNPYLEDCLLKFPKRSEKRVLILGTGTSKEQLVNFCKHLKNNQSFRDYEFVLRPHPWERSVAYTKYDDLIRIGYEIDSKENIYESLSTCAVIFGEMSTAIFEATVYDLPAFLIGTDHCRTNVTKNTPFRVLDISSQVSEINFFSIQKPSTRVLWEKNWKKNFQFFITKFINS